MAQFFPLSKTGSKTTTTLTSTTDLPGRRDLTGLAHLLTTSMNTLNETLFLYLNSPAHLGSTALLVSTFLAEGLIWLMPAGLLLGWLFGDDTTRRAMIEATMASMAALLLAQLIGMVWVHPRPFMIGIGHTHLVHVADASFPSDHLTLWWTVSFSLVNQSRLRAVGLSLSVLGIAVAWARIYLGVHFPLDMAGAAVLALACSEAIAGRRESFVEPPFEWACAAHRTLLSPLIRRGWVRG